MTQDRQQLPTSGVPTGFCPKCKAYTGFNPTTRAMVSPRYTSTFSTIIDARQADAISGSAGTWMEIWACQVCSCTILILEHRLLIPSNEPSPPFMGQGRVERVLARKLIYPRPEPRPLDPVIPEKVRSVFAEAGKAEQAGALRAAAVMYRAAVEEVCADKQAPGKNLREQIQGLASVGVAADLVDALDEARLLGNWSIHQGVTFAADEVADVAQLIDEALFEIYVQPAQRQAMRDARKARRDANPRR